MTPEQQLRRRKRDCEFMVNQITNGVPTLEEIRQGTIASDEVLASVEDLKQLCESREAALDGETERLEKGLEKFKDEFRKIDEERLQRKAEKTKLEDAFRAEKKKLEAGIQARKVQLETNLRDEKNQLEKDFLSEKKQLEEDWRIEKALLEAKYNAEKNLIGINFEGQKSQLEADLRAKKQAEDNLIAERDRIEEDLNSSTARGTNLEAEKTLLKAKGNQLEVEKDQFKTERDQLRIEKTRLEIEKSQLRTRGDQLEVEMVQLGTEKSKLEHDSSELRAARGHLQEILDKKQSSFAVQTLDLRTLREDIEELKEGKEMSALTIQQPIRGHRSNSGTISDLRRRLKSARRSIVAKDAEILARKTAAEESRMEKDAEIVGLEETARQAGTDAEQKGAEPAECHESPHGAEEDVYLPQRMLEDEQKDISERDSKISDLEAQLALTHSEKDVRIYSLKTQLELVQSERDAKISDLGTQLERASSNVSSLARDLIVERDMVSQKTLEISDLEKKRRDLDQTRRDLDQRLIDAQTDLNRLSSELKTERETVLRKETEKSDLDRQFCVVRSDLTRLTEELSAGREEIFRLNTQVTSRDTRIAELERHVTDLGWFAASQPGAAAPDQDYLLVWSGLAQASRSAGWARCRESEQPWSVLPPWDGEKDALEWTAPTGLVGLLARLAICPVKGNFEAPIRMLHMLTKELGATNMLPGGVIVAVLERLVTVVEAIYAGANLRLHVLLFAILLCAWNMQKRLDVMKAELEAIITRAEQLAKQTGSYLAELTAVFRGDNGARLVKYSLESRDKLVDPVATNGQSSKIMYSPGTRLGFMRLPGPRTYIWVFSIDDRTMHAVHCNRGSWKTTNSYLIAAPSGDSDITIDCRINADRFWLLKNMMVKS
ncbi:hypothetical protein F5Y04DRAFT_283564 [Hypomontagnella monticulosa]|nr:hypothetical protein F5Y04DRAFT_283564 [Hypomontagnella monticulosa]